MNHSQKLMASFFVSRGDGPEIFETVDAALDDISALVQFRIEMGGSSTCTASGNTRFARILTLWTDHPNPAPPQQSTIFGLSVGAVYTEERRTLPGASRSCARNANSVQHGNHVRWVTGLPSGEQHRKRATIPIGQDMNFSGASTSADAEPLVGDTPLFSSLARCFLAPTAARWA